jgi:hypothetical protein
MVQGGQVYEDSHVAGHTGRDPSAKHLLRIAESLFTQHMTCRRSVELTLVIAPICQVMQQQPHTLCVHPALSHERAKVKTLLTEPSQWFRLSRDCLSEPGISCAIARRLPWCP